MSRKSLPVVQGALAVLVLLASGALRAQAAPEGPAFGSNRYTAAIDGTEADPDVDDYVAPLLAGEKLSVTVAAAKGSTLRPTLVLVAPDGRVVTPKIKSKGGGKSLAVKNFVVTAPGRWAVRIAGGATQGAYAITFKVAASKALKLSNQTLTAAEPTRASTFARVVGASVDLTVKWDKKQSAVAFRSLTGPAGVEVPGDAGPAFLESVPFGKTGLQLQGVVLPGPDGTHTVVVGTDGPSAKYTLQIAVTPARPSDKRPIDLGAEPRLDILAAPVRGVPGRRVTLTGAGFATDKLPAVLFGGVAGTGVSVATDGRSLSVEPPGGTPSSTVDVAVRNPDGQASTRTGYFFYVPAATVTDLVTAAGAPARIGASAGGDQLRLLGTNLSSSGTVLFSGTPAVVPFSDSTTDLPLVTPAHPAGDAVVSFQDAFGRTVDLPFTFAFKAPPAIASVAPPYGAAAGGTTITLSGSAFSASDTLTVGGAPQEFTLVSPVRITFTSPAGAAGAANLVLTDSLGATAGADFEIKAAPSLAGVTLSGGPSLGTNGVPFAGGTSFRASGGNFRAGDSVTLGGASIVPSSLTATQFDGVVPASSTAGTADLVVSDLAGQSSTFTAAVHYLGFLDASAARVPAPSASDDFSAVAAAAADMDGDGAADDLVIVLHDDSTPGTRVEQTRMLLGDGEALEDATDTNIPPNGSDFNGVDTWSAQSVAIGDLDTGAGKDIVIAGDITYSYYSYYNYYDVRIMTNDGKGAQSFDAYLSPIQQFEDAYAYDTGSGYVYPLLIGGHLGGEIQALAIGDMDGDGDDDVVTASDRYRTVFRYFARSDVDFSKKVSTDTYVLEPGFSYYGYYYPVREFSSSTRWFENDSANGNRFRDTSFVRMPTAGDFTDAKPAFCGRDLALGDLDGDSDLDIVVTWDAPTTVTAQAQYYSYYGAGYDPSVATRVLANDGKGNFTDETAAWMPGGKGDEWWQGSRCALVNLDPLDDDDLDLVLLDKVSIDAFTGKPTFGKPALRVLRNNGKAFVDVTASVLPGVPLAGTADDNLRGEALLVTDVDGDGRPDILVGTTEALETAAGTDARRTRLLLGQPDGTFRDATAFLPAATDDSGECQSLTTLDVAGRPEASLFLMSAVAPAKSAGSRLLRCFEWSR